MRRLLVVALLLAGLCAPPAVLAQVGGSPGITTPVSFANTTLTGTTKFGSGTCASSGAVPFTGGTPSISFTADTDSGFCWDTSGGSASNVGIALIKDGRQLARFSRAGGFLYGHNTGGTLKGQAFGWDLGGGTMYSWDATGAVQRIVGTWGYDTAATPTPGALTLSDNVGLAFQGSSLDANLTYVTVTNPTAVRTFTIPNFSGTALVSSTANEPDTGNAVWANTGSFLFEGSTANEFETELDTVDPTADNVIYLPDSSGTTLLLNATVAGTVPVAALDGNSAATLTSGPGEFAVGLLNGGTTATANLSMTPGTSYLSASDGTTTGGVEATGEGVRFLSSGAQPTCDASARGRVWYIEGGAGVLDTFEVCRKDAADNYAWVTLF